MTAKGAGAVRSVPAPACSFPASRRGFGQAATRPLGARSLTSSEWTIRSVVASCTARSASASTPTAIALAKTSQVRAVPEKARAATRDQSATRPSRPWPTRCEVFFDVAALAAASRAIPVETPNAVQPAGPADQAIDAPVRNAAATTNRPSSRNRELILMTEHLLCAAAGSAIPCPKYKGGSLAATALEVVRPARPVAYRTTIDVERMDTRRYFMTNVYCVTSSGAIAFR